MSRKLPIIIRCFTDFINNFPTIYYAIGKLHPCFNLDTAHNLYWQFVGGYSEEQLNRDMFDNTDLYDWNDSISFYCSNDNLLANRDQYYRGSVAFRNGKPYVKIRGGTL